MKITAYEMLLTIANMALRMDDLTSADVLDTFQATRVRGCGQRSPHDR